MEPTQNPDIEWYLKVSSERSVTPRCPFASVERCPRYYESLSLLGKAGSTQIPAEEDRRLKAFWEKTDLWPKTGEEGSAIAGGERYTVFTNFCPEVSYGRFGHFASQLIDYTDEIDRDHAHQHLGRLGIPHDDWRWRWQHVQPMHFTECPRYSPLLHSSKSSIPSQNKEVVTLKPTFMGMSLDLNEALRRFWPRLKTWLRRQP
jgi:hypothetical protein